MKTETILEYCALGGAQIDRAGGMIRNVRIIGRESRNGRAYPAATLHKAVALYEGSAVNVNHPRGHATSPRDYQDRIGRIRNVRADAGGLRADFQYNPKHPLAEQLIWDAEHSPENVGFSHNVEARVANKNGRVIVEEIIKVQSVDLVADPATTRGLFENMEHDPRIAKRRLVLAVAKEAGLPEWCVPPLDSGLSYRKSPLEILEYLVAIRRNLEKNGVLKPLDPPPTVERVFDLPCPAAAADFAAEVCGCPTAAECEKFVETLTGDSSPKNSKQFAKEILE